ncbi:hypothetical protein [Alcaligenes sp. SDU_A2]|uniref:hypothetical protein n=1 Tax=Alcaligenes sp. SDU_A2 TaxID=3136634 RepID=UPI00311D995F
MAWYDAGTVNVTLNSATVTGVGTQWLAGARQGEAFVGPDGRLYEVLNIASDTVLTLTKPYRGATQTAQPYALAPLQGYVKELADRAAELLRRYYDALTLAENSIQKSSIGSKYWATADQLLPGNAYGLGGAPDPYPHVSVNMHAVPGEYTCAAGVADTPGGAGVLIREGLSGPGGTCLLDRFCTEAGRQFWRARAGTGLWSGWSETITVGNAASLLGLKSGAFADLVGDVGTGAAMQSGGNANGSWWRFQNGLQVCRQRAGISGGGSTIFGITWTFPVEFLNDTEYFSSVSAHIGSGTPPTSVAFHPQYQNKLAASCRYLYQSPGDVVADFFAAGRWK